MKTVFHLKLNKRDDYVYTHDTLICKILKIDTTDKQVIEDISKFKRILI